MAGITPAALAARRMMTTQRASCALEGYRKLNGLRPTSAGDRKIP
jgi:hypothetical protein